MRLHRLNLLLLALFWFGIATTSAADRGLTVHDAWIRSGPPNAPVLAGYMTIENRSTGGKSLVGAASSAFGNVTIHRTELNAGVARMSHVPAVDIAAHGRLVFQPDGYHLMLAEPKRPLRTNDQVPIDLIFSGGLRVAAVFIVREPGAAQEKSSSHAGHGSMTH